MDGRGFGQEDAMSTGRASRGVNQSAVSRGVWWEGESPAGTETLTLPRRGGIFLDALGVPRPGEATRTTN